MLAEPISPPRPRRSATANTFDPRLQTQELHHRIANSLQLAADMLLFEQLRSRDPQAQAALEASHSRLIAVSELHRYLHAHADEVDVELSVFLAGLGHLIAIGAGLDCHVEASSLSLPGAVAQQLGIAINECAINAAKHAYRGAPGGKLWIRAHPQGDRLTVVVADDGVGLRGHSGPCRPGLGSAIIHAIIQGLNGRVRIRSEAGLKVTMTLPLPVPPTVS